MAAVNFSHHRITRKSRILRLNLGFQAVIHTPQSDVDFIRMISHTGTRYQTPRDSSPEFHVERELRNFPREGGESVSAVIVFANIATELGVILFATSFDANILSRSYDEEKIEWKEPSLGIGIILLYKLQMNVKLNENQINNPT